MDLYTIELESYVRQIIKGYDYERDKKYIEHNTSDLNAVILHFRAGVQSDSEQTPFICLITFLIILVFIYRFLMAIRNLTLTYIGWTGKLGCHRASASKFRYPRAHHSSNRIDWFRRVDFGSHFFKSKKVSA